MSSSVAVDVPGEAPQFGGEPSLYENGGLGSQIVQQPLSTQNSEAQLVVSSTAPLVASYPTGAYASSAHYQQRTTTQQYSPSTLTSAYGTSHQQVAYMPAEYQTGGYQMAAYAQYGQQQQYASTTTQAQLYGGTGYYTGQTGVSSTGQVYRSVSAATEGSRVVGHEYGAERVVSVTSRVDESRASIISERYVEHEVRVPKKIVREEVIEKVIVVPEKLVQEEIIEELQKVREKIIEIAKPTIVEKIVEVPEIEYVERIVEVPEKIIQEKIINQEKVVLQERIIEVPKIIPQERIVEIPDVQYRDVPVERIIEVPEYHEEVILKEIPVPQYVDKPVPQHVNVEVPLDIERSIPVPVEAVVAYEYRMPRMKPKYSKVTYPVYLPRFIEVPVAVELLNAGLLSQAEAYLASVNQLTRSAASLCEVETLAAQIMKSDFQSQLQSVDLQAAVLKAWQHNAVGVSGTGQMIMPPAASASYAGGASYAGASSYSQYQAKTISGGAISGGMLASTTTGVGMTTSGMTAGGMLAATSAPMLGTTGATILPQIPASSSSHREHHKKSKRSSKKSSNQ